MISDVMHIGLTVLDLDRSVAFYRDVLGLAYQGELVMEGPATDRLFGRPDSRARVAYLSRGTTLNSPPGGAHPVHLPPPGTAEDGAVPYL